MLVGSPIESGFFSSSTPFSLSYQKGLAKGKTPKDGIYILTEVTYFWASGSHATL